MNENYVDIYIMNEKNVDIYIYERFLSGSIYIMNGF